MQNPARKVVAKETGAGKGACRRVTLILPASPAVGMAMSPYEPLEGDINGVDNVGGTGVDIAEGRNFQWASLDPDHDLCFLITAEQEISLIAESENARVTVIIEYLA